METPLHPRPQLARDGWIDLCGRWDFTFDERNDTPSGSRNWPVRFDRTIQVPFPPESEASGIGDTGYHPSVWYRRTFDAPELNASRLVLHFGAVDYRARVWVNDQLVVEHEGGQTPFFADITDALLPSLREQVIVVNAVDDPHDLAQPRGKQDWRREPHQIWYHRTTGIWQPVWLEVVAASHIAAVQWTPNPEDCTLGVDVRFSRPIPSTARLEIELSLGGTVVVDDIYRVAGASTFRRTIGLDVNRLTMDRDEWLWSPEYPNLIDARLRLVDADGGVIDAVRSYAGMRSASVGNGRFLLNDRPYYLRLVLGQGYWPESHLAAPSEDALRREVELIKSLGFNGVRIHQKVEDPRFLYWCDRLGLLVWGEMANAFVYTSEAVQRLTREWLEVLARDYSHPCIVTWVPLNESWGVPSLDRDPAQRDFVRALYHLTKSVDPTRPVIGNDGWEHVVTDMLSIHDYTQSGQALLERYGSREAIERTMREVQPGERGILAVGAAWDGEPIVLTEFGGMSFAPSPDRTWFGYGQVPDADVYLERYAELIGAILESSMVCGFCYTQLADTGQETNGLLTADRQPKLDPQAVSQITRGVPRIAPVEAVLNLLRDTHEPHRVSVEELSKALTQ